MMAEPCSTANDCQHASQRVQCAECYGRFSTLQSGDIHIYIYIYTYTCMYIQLLIIVIIIVISLLSLSLLLLIVVVSSLLSLLVLLLGPAPGNFELWACWFWWSTCFSVSVLCPLARSTHDTFLVRFGVTIGLMNVSMMVMTASPTVMIHLCITYTHGIYACTHSCHICISTPTHRVTRRCVCVLWRNAIFWYSTIHQAIVGVPWGLRRLSLFSTCWNMCLTNKSPQAKHAETDPCHGTPAMAHFQLPEQSVSKSPKSRTPEGVPDNKVVIKRPVLIIQIRKTSNGGSQIPYPSTRNHVSNHGKSSAPGSGRGSKLRNCTVGNRHLIWSHGLLCAYPNQQRAE